MCTTVAHFAVLFLATQRVENISSTRGVCRAVQSSGPSQSEHDAESCSLRLETFEDGAMVLEFDSGVRFVSQIYYDM